MHVLFVGQTDEKTRRSFLKAVERASTLTLGEGDDFVKHGGMIGLVNRGDKVKFEYNLAALRRAGLRVNSAILQLGAAKEAAPRKE